jgi:aspartate-semialdehyde dehydrogenase
MDNALKLAIVGTNGLVTESLLAAIERHPTLRGEVVLLGPTESCGTPVEFNQQTLLIEDIEAHSFNHIHILVVTGEMAYRGDWLERALDAGCVVLDVDGQLPGQGQYPLVAADVNPSLLDAVTPGSVVVLPDAASVQCASLLHPLLQQFEMERVSLFSCHAVSEKGRSGVEEMARQTAQLLSGKPVRPMLFPRQVAFNLVPMAADEATGIGGDPESRIAERLRQLLEVPEMPLLVSCCWSPVFYGHSQRLHFTAASGVTVETIERILSQVAYIEAKRDHREQPTAVTDASGSDLLVVGRLTSYPKISTDFSLWGVADNLRFGIARNAVKIIELLVKRLFISYS